MIEAVSAELDADFWSMKFVFHTRNTQSNHKIQMHFESELVTLKLRVNEDRAIQGVLTDGRDRSEFIQHLSKFVRILSYPSSRALFYCLLDALQGFSCIDVAFGFINPES